MNKQGAFTDLFVFMIIAFIVVVISVVFIFIVGQVKTGLHDSLDNLGLGDTEGNNASVVIENTIGQVGTTYQSLRWISFMLIFGMALGIFIGSYLVTTKPVFFIPYIFIVIIAIVVSVPISNTYETLTQDPTLATTFSQFTASNWLISNLPTLVTIIGFIGGIIMYSRIGKQEDYATYGY